MAEPENIPQTIGRYEIKSLLGSGAMGSVYLAEDPRIKRKLAVKVVRMDAIRNESDRKEYLARFQREAEVSGVLNDPGIVTIYDVGDSDLGPFLAMEYVPGNPLDALIKSGQLQAMPLRAKLQIIASIATALDHAHSHNIVHRDVKPGNVMISEDGRAKLMDFGIAKREDASLTQTGTFLGTPSYASPEQIKEGQATNRSDIFSFGVMVFEILSGNLPFPGNTINTILYRIVNEPPIDIKPPVLGLLPESWQRIFSRVLAKAPEERFPTCGAFVRDLVDASTELDKNERLEVIGALKGGSGSPVPPILSRAHDETMYIAPDPGKGGSWIGKAAGILLLLGALGGGAYFFTRGGTSKVALSTDPPGAVVIKNGVTVGTTPCTVALAPGDKCSFERKGCKPPSEYVHQKGATPQPFVLERIITEETIRSIPPGAKVNFDGKELEQPTPVTVRFDQSEPHSLSLTKDSSLSVAWDYKPGETLPIPDLTLIDSSSADPNAPGTLRLQGGSYAVMVKIDGKPAGELAPGGTLSVAPGSHHLELSAASVFYRGERSVTVEPGKTVALPVPGTAQVTISTFPVDGILTVDDQLTTVESTGDAAIRVAKGPHKFGVKGKSGSKRIDVQGDLSDKFQVN